MAIVNTEQAGKAANGFMQLSIVRQFGLLIGLAASIAMGVGIVMWAQEPHYQPIYSHLSPADAQATMDVLQQAGIEFRVDQQNGSISVPNDQVYIAKIKLSAEGLPHGQGFGFESLDKASSFGTSRFMETARHRRALEGELARTISKFRKVKKARVHLAIPKESVFVRSASKVRASVFVDLYSGHKLGPAQVASIVNLVSSSVANLEANNVTVVDQNGHLLSDATGNSVFALADKQYSYTRQLENNYAKRIEDILIPILGVGRVKAKVAASLDFTHVEQTQESYDPNSMVVRSEQIIAEQPTGDAPAEGIPGAQSNKPKAAEIQRSGSNADSNKKGDSQNLRKQSIKNYELNKTISHTKFQAGKILRLTVAVVVDDKTVRDADGKVKKEPLSEEDIKRITSLVYNAVGIDEARGDSVNVINTAFMTPEKIASLPEESLLEQPWVQNLIKQILGGLGVLILIFGLLRPLMKSLAQKASTSSPAGLANNGQQALPAGGGQLTQQPDGAVQIPEAPKSYQEQMSVVKNMAADDPKRVAQVVKSWVDED